MKSIKTGFVVVVMLGVVWGVWKMLNKQPVLPAGIRDGSISLGMPSTNFANSGNQEGSQLQPLQIEGPGAGAVTQNGQSHQDHSMATHLESQVDPYAKSPADTNRFAADNNQAAYPANPNPQNSGGFDQPEAQPNANDRFAVANQTDRFATSEPPVVSASAVEDSAYSADAGSTATATDSDAFRLAWEGVQDQLSRSELKEALFTLSLWYNSPEVPAEMMPELTDILDQLAGTVIYSRQHLLESAYIVNQGETLEDIAVQYDVPWQLLANINGITDPRSVQPGMSLKVVRGPFNAQVSLERKELTLFVGRHYAGRFPVELGNDPEPMKGEYAVREKETQRTFIDRDGRTFAPGQPGNPYGAYWIGLGGRLGIHGQPDAPASGSTGSIMVSSQDAVDLFAILSENSKVEIRR